MKSRVFSFGRQNPTGASGGASTGGGSNMFEEEEDDLYS